MYGEIGNIVLSVNFWEAGTRMGLKFLDELFGPLRAPNFVSARPKLGRMGPPWETI